MGDQADCTLLRGGSAARGRAHLESDRVLFRGAARASILFSEVTSATVSGEGDLELGTASGPVTLAGLGAKAPRWARAIREPKSVLEKLGVRAGMRVELVDLEDAAFSRELLERGAVLISDSEGGGPADALFFLVADPAALGRVGALRGRLSPAGALWLLRPKGPGAAVKELDVLEAGRAAGLVDTKVVAFSTTLSAAKFVIPVAERSGAGSKGHAG
ncbi:MAG TPA: hypothetical protein VFW71_07885 [Actinomycetota bacterium]|nr:hypothetical protein [Actinomycetota bacterium]